jgi:hypothetical protein
MRLLASLTVVTLVTQCSPEKKESAPPSPESTLSKKAQEALDEAARLGPHVACKREPLAQRGKSLEDLPPLWPTAEMLQKLCRDSHGSALRLSNDCQGYRVLEVGEVGYSDSDAFYEAQGDALIGIRVVGHVGCSEFGDVPAIRLDACSFQEICSKKK